MIRWAALLAAFLVLGGYLYSTQLVGAEDNCGGIADEIGHGGVVWTENAIVVQGTAAPNLSDPYKPVSAVKRETQRAATLDAYRKIAEVLAGVSITSDRLAADTPQVLTQIQAYVPQPEICDSKFYADGGIDIVVKVALAGELAKALLPSAGARVATAKSRYTGLIIDARDLPFTPALAPRLLTPDGRVLFSQENVKLEVIAARGAVRYLTHPTAIKKHMVGTRPLKVRAVRLGSLSPNDLVLDQKSAEELIDLPAFLGDAKIVILTSAVQKLACHDLAAKVKDRVVDWERKIVLARGFGKVDFSGKEDNTVRLRMMERAAEVDAQRKLLEILLDLKIDATQSLKHVPTASKYAQGVVKNAARCDAKYYKDGTSEVVLAARIDGMAVKGANLGQQGVSSKTVLEPAGISGLIVDASGLNFTPVLAPQLAAPNGTVIYDHNLVARGYAQQYGVVGYQFSLDAAKSDKRIGKSPIIVRASQVVEDSGRLVLAAKDADKLRHLNRMAGLFSQGRVLIVTENTIEN